MRSARRACVLGGCLLAAIAIGDDAASGAAAPDAVQTWFDAAFSATPPQQQAVDRLVLVREGAAGDTKINRCAAGGPLRLGEKTYRHGIGVNSHSVLRVELSRPAARFLSDIGMDRNVDGTVASSAFHVAVGGRDVFATRVLRPADGVKHIDVPLGGARQFELIVDEGGDTRGYDQGDWGDAKVVFADGSERYLDELAHAWSALPGLPVSFHLGGRPSSELLPKWRRTSVDGLSDAEITRRTLVLSDPATGLELRIAAVRYRRFPAIEWTIHFSNRGDRPAPVLEQVRAVDVGFQAGLGTPVMLDRLVGSPCRVDDWAPLEDAVPPGKAIQFAPSGGRSSSGASPFFNVRTPSGGLITAIGWSGQWTATVSRAADGVVRIAAGLEAMRLSLKPGETIRGPRILQVHWAGDDPWVGYNQFRRLMTACIVPRRGGRPVLPPIAHLSTAFYELNATNETNVRSHLKSLDGLGFEIFWVDAYWTRDGFPEGMGHYGFPLERAEPRDRFPRGVRAAADEIHAAGLGYLMWFEPERVAPGTLLAKEHPDWLLKQGSESGGHLDLGNPAAREYMTRYLIAAAKQYRLDWLRIDYNIDPLPFWQARDRQAPDRVGLAEIRHIEGLYRTWDDLLAACPGLAIDNCASGGRRIDLETCARSVPLWRTDATIDPLMQKDFDQAALQNQVMTAGLNRYVPASVSGQMGAGAYHFRSGYNGGIAFCEDCRTRGYPRELLRKAVAEAKQLRRYWGGDFYALSDVTTSPREWCVMQYHLPESHEGIVMAFRRHRSPYSAYQPTLRAIDAKATYEVLLRGEDYAIGSATRMTGAALARRSLAIDVCPGSLVLQYRRVGP